MFCGIKPHFGKGLCKQITMLEYFYLILQYEGQVNCSHFAILDDDVKRLF